MNMYSLPADSSTGTTELNKVKRFLPSRKKWFGGNTNGAIFSLKERRSYLLEVWFTPTALKFTKVSFIYRIKR